MKRKSLLLAASLTAIVFASQAQWTDTYQPRKATIAANNDFVSIDASGNVIVAGAFNEEFSFGNVDLAPVAQSIYIVKYSASGTKQNAVAIKGAASLTAMTTDPDGNLYVAGQYADEVIFGSTNSVTDTITGINNAFGEVITTLGAGFIAKYDPNGVLIKVQEYKPSPFPAALDESIVYYDQNLSFRPSHLQFTGGKLYASLRSTGVLESNGHTLNGSYITEDGMFFEAYSGAIVEINTGNLQIDRICATLRPKLNLGQYDVVDVLFSISENTLYSAFYTRGGTDTLTIGNASQVIAFENEGSSIDNGHVFVTINLSDNTYTERHNFTSTGGIDYEYALHSLVYHDGKVIVSGTFGLKPLVFKTELTANGPTDVFSAIFNAGDLSQPTSVVRSNVAGTDRYASSSIYGGKLNIACNDTARTSGILSVNLTGGATAYTSETAANTYTNAIAARDGKLVKVKASTSTDDAALSTVTVSSEIAPTGIHLPKYSAPAVEFYPNPVTSVLYLSTTGDIEVYNSVGIPVKRAAAVNQLPVEQLPAGVYFATVKTSAGAGTIKFVKK